MLPVIRRKDSQPAVLKKDSNLKHGVFQDSYPDLCMQCQNYRASDFFVLAAYKVMYAVSMQALATRGSNAIVHAGVQNICCCLVLSCFDRTAFTPQVTRKPAFKMYGL